MNVVAGEAVIGGAEAGVRAEGQSCVRVGMRQGRCGYEALALHWGHG